MGPIDVRPAASAVAANTRLEAFVDAAFAFAVTLLVISADAIPDSLPALVLAMKSLPSFAASFAMVAMFWYAHVQWSRRYRLQTAPAVLLSLLLVFLVLVYVYPLRLLFASFFAWASGGWLPLPMQTLAHGDIPWLYVIYGVAFSSMSACIAGLHALAWRMRHALELETAGARESVGQVAVYLFMVLAGATSAVLAALLPPDPTAWMLALPGMLYFLLFFSELAGQLGERWAAARMQIQKSPGA